MVTDSFVVGPKKDFDPEKGVDEQGQTTFEVTPDPWQILGQGQRGEKCLWRRPKAWSTFQGEGVVIWDHRKCKRRDCPVCVDRGYVRSTVDRQVAEIQRSYSSLARDGWHRKIVPIVRYDQEIGEWLYYGDQWRRLSAYHVIISLCEDDEVSSPEHLALKREEVTGILRKMGAVIAWITPHPYRGDKGGSGYERRLTLDRSHQSLHFHALVLAYWLIPAVESPHYPKLMVKIPTKKEECGISGILGTVEGSKNKEQPAAEDLEEAPGRSPDGDQVRRFWHRIRKVLTYELDHAGYIEGHQISTRIGPQLDIEPEDIRPTDVMVYRIDSDELEALRNTWIHAEHEVPQTDLKYISLMLKYGQELKLHEGIQRNPWIDWAEWKKAIPYGGIDYWQEVMLDLKTTYHFFYVHDQSVIMQRYSNEEEKWDLDLLRRMNKYALPTTKKIGKKNRKKRKASPIAIAEEGADPPEGELVDRTDLLPHPLVPSHDQVVDQVLEAHVLEPREKWTDRYPIYEE